MADSAAELPPRPAKYPKLVPGKLDIFRAIALFTVSLAIIFQIVTIYADHQAYNDYGTMDMVDPIGFPFYIVGGILDLYLIVGAIIFCRRAAKRQNFSSKYIPHPGYLLFFDLCVTCGLLGWGPLCAFFGIAGEDPLSALYAFGLILVALAHLKLTVDDCRYIHFRRKENRRRSQNVMMDSVQK